MAKYPAKYVWASLAFDTWIKDQQKLLSKAGFKVSTAGVTQKLLNDVLLPNEIKLRMPKLELIKKRGRNDKQKRQHP